MTQPTNYTPTTDFSQQESINASGRSTVNTAALDAEFANIETTLDQTVSNLSLIQRDDGRLKDVSVEIHTISPEVLNLIGGGYALRGLWAEATVYAVNDICSNGAYTYVCRTAHTSGGSFDGQYWTQFGFTSGADAAAAAAAAQSSATSAAGSATAAGNSATAAAASASSADSSASNSASSSSYSSSMAANAAASATSASNSAALAAASASSLNYDNLVAKSGSTMTGPLVLASGSTAPNPSTGTRSTAIATMQKFADEFGSSIASNGYQKLSSGLIVQWGSIGVTADSTTSVTVPLAFPTAFLQVMAIIKDNASAYANKPVVAAVPINNASFSLRCYYTTENTVAWIAIGH